MAFQKKCLGKMDNVTREGRTVLFVSHNMAAIRSLCKRVIMLEQGGIEREGTANEVVTYYQEKLADAVSADNLEPGVWILPDGNADHQAVIERIEMLEPETGRVKKHLMAGDAVPFRLHYRSKVNFREASIVFGVFSTGGVHLLRYNTEVDGVYSPISRGIGYLDCVFESFPLTAGRYVIATTVGKKGIKPLYQCYNYGHLDVWPRYDSNRRHVYNSQLCFISTKHWWAINGEKAFGIIE